MDLKHLTKNKFFEPFLLFCLFYLPGFIFKSRGDIFSAFNNIEYHIILILTLIPQIVLILYLMKYSPVNTEIIPSKKPWFEFYGIRPNPFSKFRKIRWANLAIPGKAILIAISMLIINFLVGKIVEILGLQELKIPQPDAVWYIESPGLMYLFILTSQVVGWSEEFFFRGFLLTRFCIEGEKTVFPVLLISILFGIGHIYQGVTAFIVATILGVALSLFYLKNKDLVSIAIGHGFYNLIIMVLSTYLKMELT